MTNAPTTSPRIFVSHCSKDNDFVIQLVVDLRRMLDDATAVWYNSQGEVHGGSGWSKIAEELTNRHVFILVLSPDALNSEVVLDELRIAWREKNSETGKLIIPVLYHRCEIRDDLDTLQIINFLPPRSYGEAFKELVEALELPAARQAPLTDTSEDTASSIEVAGAVETVATAIPSAEPTRAKRVKVPGAKNPVLLVLALLIGLPGFVAGIGFFCNGTLTILPPENHPENWWQIPIGIELLVIGVIASSWRASQIRPMRGISAGRRLVAGIVWLIGLSTIAFGAVPIVLGFLGRWWLILLGIGAVILGIFLMAQERRIRLHRGIRPAKALPAPDNILYTYCGHGMGLMGQVYALMWSPDGRRIVSASWDTVKVWNAVTGNDITTYRGHSGRTVLIRAVSWSPDGRWIASVGGSDETVQIWDASTGKNIFTYKGHTTDTRHKGLWDGVHTMAWSPNGKRIASGGKDKTIRVWDATTGKYVFNYPGHARWLNGTVTTLTWSPDSTRIVSASNVLGDKIQVWKDNASGEALLSFGDHTDVLNALAWSPDGKFIASASSDTTVRVWDATTGERIYTYRGHSDLARAVAWSPDSKRIASASDDNTVQVWDAISGDNIFTYSGHSGRVNAVAWKPDGTCIASASDDKTVQVWRAM